MLIAALEDGGNTMTCSIGTPQQGVMQRASIQTTSPEATIPQIVEFIQKF